MAADYSRTAAIHALIREMEGQERCVCFFGRKRSRNELGNTAPSTAVVALDNQRRPPYPYLSRLSTSSDLSPLQLLLRRFVELAEPGMWLAPRARAVARPLKRTRMCRHRTYTRREPVGTDREPHHLYDVKDGRDGVRERKKVCVLDADAREGRGNAM
ncbi:hypothetical protein B0H12DRAFT_376846 [Mycena haematopus]|nr:hypothetical protein B0H12DRAFT_376846 [Mycena haematopus]